MHAGSFLKLQMELAYPLVTPARSGGKEELECTLTKVSGSFTLHSM